MPTFACKLLALAPVGTRSRARLRRPAGSTGEWVCLELAGRPAEPALRNVRELVVRQPAALSLAVLAAAPRLRSVVLPEHHRLPAPVAAELARRQVAVVWRHLSDSRPPSEPRGTCAMSRRAP